MASFVMVTMPERSGQCLPPLRRSAPTSAGGWKIATPGHIKLEHTVVSPRLARNVMAMQMAGLLVLLAAVHLGNMGVRRKQEPTGHCSDSSSLKEMLL